MNDPTTNHEQSPPMDRVSRARLALPSERQEGTVVPTSPEAVTEFDDAPDAGMAGGWTIRRKLLTSFGAMVVLIASLGAISIYSISRLRDITSVLSDQDMTLIRTASLVQLNIVHRRHGRLIYLERGEVQAYQSAADSMQQALAEIRQTSEKTDNVLARESLSRISQAIANYLTMLESWHLLIENQRLPDRRLLQEAAGRVDSYLNDLDLASAVVPPPTAGPATPERDAVTEGGGLQELHDILIRAAVNLRVYTIRPDARFASEVEKNLAEAAPRLEVLRRQATGTAAKTIQGLHKEVAQIRSDFAALRAVETRIMELDAALLSDGHIQAAVAAHLYEMTIRNAQADSDRAKTLATFAMWTIIGMTSLLVLIGLGVATLLPLSIARNLAELVRVARRVGQGDLTTDASIRSRDELGQLARSLSGMRANLHRIVDRIQRTSLSLVTATNEILASSEQQSRTSTQQSSFVNEISATVNELNATAGELNRNTQIVADRANDCAATSQRADQAVHEALDGMQRITATNATAMQRFTALAEKIEAIESVLATVSQIAERTELLSLNASIEAAKAGEQGKGFAVVAGEIRRLADRTGEASQQVGRLVGEIRAATDASVMSMEQSSQEIRNGSTVMSGFGQNMQSIDHAVRDILQQMEGIRNAAEQLATASSQVSIAVSSIQEGTNQVSTGARQAAAGAYSLNSTAGELRESVSEFRLIRR